VNKSGLESGDVGGGNVMNVPDPCGFAEFEHIAGAVKIGSPGFAGAVGPEEFQNGGAVNDAVAVLTDPFAIGSGESEEWLADITIEHHGAWQRPLVLLFPVLHDLFDAFACRGSSGAANDESELVSVEQEIANQVSPNESGSAGDQYVHYQIRLKLFCREGRRGSNRSCVGCLKSVSAVAAGLSLFRFPDRLQSQVCVETENRIPSEHLRPESFPCRNSPRMQHRFPGLAGFRGTPGKPWGESFPVIADFGILPDSAGAEKQLGGAIP